VSDASKALSIWQGVVQGHCSVLDSFDAGGRHFVVINAIAHDSGGWPELTRRERQVVACASLGESRKATGYRLGISRPHVSCVLKSAMRKLGVKTQAQLVFLMRGFQRQANPNQ
jgi:DNA-binding CsgD family transcriptional regulator